MGVFAVQVRPELPDRVLCGHLVVDLVRGRGCNEAGWPGAGCCFVGQVVVLPGGGGFHLGPGFAPQPGAHVLGDILCGGATVDKLVRCGGQYASWVLALSGCQVQGGRRFSIEILDNF